MINHEVGVALRSCAASPHECNDCVFYGCSECKARLANIAKDYILNKSFTDFVYQTVLCHYLDSLNSYEIIEIAFEIMEEDD